MTRALPIFGERALHLVEENALVVGDLHVGLESELRSKGVHLPSQTTRMREKLDALLATTGATRLIILGDLKHRIPFSTRQEIAELPWFFRGLRAQVELVPGNHDVDIGGLLDIQTHDASGIVVGDVGLHHGHTWPDAPLASCRTLVTCHNHPAVMLVDELGHRHKEPCWMRASFTPAAYEWFPTLPPDASLIVMPAFNELTGGTALNAREGSQLMGPLFTNDLIAVDEARLWTLDGVELGSVGGLRRYTRDEDKRVRTSGAKATKRGKRGSWIK